MTEPVIDPTAFAELQAAAGRDFVVELVATFLEEAPQMLAELRAAQTTASADRFRRAAHSLKSNGLTFGALKLGALARELEVGGLTPEAAPLDALQAEYERAAAALRRLGHG